MSDTKDQEAMHAVTTIEADASTVALLNKSEIDQQIATAKRYPRTLKHFRDEVTALATLTQDVAEECSYALPRDGKMIVGPSARFAEILASAWGNCRAGARVVEDRGQFIVAQGTFFDLQKNTAIQYEVQRRVVDKNGRRYKDDMVGVTANAACSIALRNAILKGVPKALWQDLWANAKRVAVGDGSTIAERRERAFKKFAQMGVSEKMILDKLQRASVADITIDDLETLFGMFAALKEGDSTVDELFTYAPEVDKTTGEISGKGGDALKSAVEQARAQHGATGRTGGKIDAGPGGGGDADGAGESITSAADKIDTPAAPTYAQIADAINKAQTKDDCDVCADLVRSMSDKMQQQELASSLLFRRGELDKAAAKAKAKK